MRGGPRNLLLRALRLPAVTRPLERVLRDRATVFMLHRFAVPDLGVAGHDPERLRSALAGLRRDGYQLLSLRDLVRRLQDARAPLRKAVAFTIDDGYFDQSEVAGPVFAEFDCPVSTFVCTGFLDGELWMWWDRIETVFRQTRRRELRVPLGGSEWSGRWSDAAARLAAQDSFTEACKSVPDAEKLAAIDRLAAAAEVALPSAPPPAYAPMTWDQLRAAERRGMSFGPHTRTHPVLSRASDEQAPREIRESCERLAQEAADPDPIFCYPNGQRGDFGARETNALGELGLEAAVVGYPGYAERFEKGGEAQYRLRRFSYSEDPIEMVQVLTGFERMKALVRREA
jgi:peptidoglycan/xylan/chitin deacetylase (PgdA/CDA1 family)